MFPVKKLTVIKLLLCTMFLSVLAVPVSAANGTYTGIVYLTDGTKYENVEFKVNNTYKTISFEYMEKKVNVSFTNIDRIYDAEDKDITAEVLGEYYKPKTPEPAPNPEPVNDTVVTKPVVKEPVAEKPSSDWRLRDENWKSEESAEYQKARKKLWNSAVCLNANFSIPTGDYYEGLTSGIGFGGDFIIALARTYGLRFTVSKSGMKPEENLILYSLDPQYVITNQDISMDAFRYLLSFQYNILLDKNSSDKSLFYAYTGMGAISEKVTIEIEYRDTVNDIILSDKTDNTESNFVITSGVGIVKMINPTIGFDIGGTVDLVLTSSEDYYESSSGAIFDLKFGLIAVF